MRPPRPRLNLVHLATLHEFGARGTLAAAAEALGYTPGAVSQHLAALERAVGTPVAEHVGRRLQLTEAGRLVLERADALLSAERETVRAVEALDRTVAGSLTIGTWGSTAATLVAPVVQACADAHPNLTISSREVDLDEASAAVRRGVVDVAFGLDYPDHPMPRDSEVTVVNLLSESFAVAMGARMESDGSFDAWGSMGWILPPVTSHYGTAVRTGLRKRGIEPRVVHEVTDTAASIQLAAAGLGATLVTPLMHQLSPGPRLHLVAMPDPLTRDVVLLASSRHRRGAVDAVVEIVARVVRDRDPGSAS